MAQFRLGILPIKIETGRFINTPANERYCENCPQLVEDEKHFLLHCPLYSDLRIILFRKATFKNLLFDNFDENEKFNFLVNILWKDASHFLSDAWLTRQNYLYVTQ